MKNIRRVALLINSQSPSNRFLPGVSIDTLNMRRYLRSPCGGSFYDSEIQILSNPSRDEVIAAILSLNADYVFIHVSAHGYTTTTNGNRMICLREGDISDKELFTASKMQLILVDTCGTWVEPKRGARIGSLEKYTEEADSFNGISWAREAFDYFIKSNLPGKMIIHASAAGESAYEDMKRKGGQFTLALLDYIGDWQLTGREGFIVADQMTRDIVPVLQGKMFSQTPVISHQTPGFTAPFGIVSPRFIENPEKAARSRTNNFLLASAVGVMLYSVLK